MRELERTLGRLARKVARRFAEGHTRAGHGAAGRPDRPARARSAFRPEQLRKELPPGVATGLAWTEAGGDVLYVEATPAAATATACG